jgi:hypothetical protein
MSAFICGNPHITALAKFAADHEVLGLTDVEFIGRLLLAENAESAWYRYTHRDDTGKRPTFRPVKWALKRRFSDAQISKAAHCLTYQSCQHPGWQGSEAKRIVDAILEIVGDRPPGYDRARWEISRQRIK